MSCRKGDSDCTLHEGGNGTLPPMPTHDSRQVLFLCLIMDLLDAIIGSNTCSEVGSSGYVEDTATWFTGD